MVAELVREAALEDVRDELPHSLAVQIEEMNPRQDRPEDRPLWDVHVNIYVERDSQKAIIIGRGGSRLEADRFTGAEGDRGAPGDARVPGPPREGPQGLAARSQVTWPSGLRLLLSGAGRRRSGPQAGTAPSASRIPLVPVRCLGVC